MSKFNYNNPEHIDVVYNYLSLVNRGLKQRNVTLGQDETLLELELPDLVQFSIESCNDDQNGSLNIQITWPVGDDDEHDEEETDLSLAAEALLAAVDKEKKKQKKKAKKEKKKRQQVKRGKRQGGAD
ncbi:MAG: amphi-Trp domain-containing protein [Pseudomonadota bacterium]